MYKLLLLGLTLVSATVAANEAPTRTLEERGPTEVDSLTCVTQPNHSGARTLRYCNQMGYLTNPSPIANGNSGVKSLDACAVKCKKTKGCISLSYDSSASAGTQCTLYSNYLRDQGLVNETTTEVFYNKHCFKCKRNRQYPGAPKACGNGGIQWAYYYNAQGQDMSNDYQNFFPEVYQTATPKLGKGHKPLLTHTLGGWYEPTSGDAGSPTIYHSNRNAQGNQYVLNHRGYIYAPKSGPYTITFGVDDAVFFWYGQYATGGYQRDNVNLAVYFQNQPTTAVGNGSLTFSLVGGTYTPFRIVYAEANFPAQLSVSIADPTGRVIVNSHKGSPYIVQYSCDGTSAPKFNAFGSEQSPMT